jgi:hypothetical protein
MSKPRPKKKTKAERKQYEISLNNFILRSYYMKVTKRLKLAKEFKELTGDEFPSDKTGWMTIARKYNFPRWGEDGAFNEDAIYAWIMGTVQQGLSRHTSTTAPKPKRKRGRTGMTDEERKRDADVYHAYQDGAYASRDEAVQALSPRWPGLTKDELDKIIDRESKRRQRADGQNHAAEPV